MMVKKSSTMKHSGFLKSLKILKAQLTQKNQTLKHFLHTTISDEVCICKDAIGEHKYLYKTKDELEYMLASKTINLKSYPCPYEKGWHLTKV